MKTETPKPAVHTHEWHAITKLPNDWQDVCVTCGEHRTVNSVAENPNNPQVGYNPDFGIYE